MPHGADQPCPRAACAGRETHLAGAHLDPRDELHDGPGVTLRALPHSVRGAAHKLVAQAPGLMPEVVEMAEEIHHLRRQVAAVQVDRDRQVRDAMARAEDCAEHGSQIQELAAQLHAAGRREDAADAGRVALLGLVQTVQDFVDSHRRGSAPKDLTVDRVVDALDRSVSRASAAHMRAWRS